MRWLRSATADSPACESKLLRGNLAHPQRMLGLLGLGQQTQDVVVGGVQRARFDDIGVQYAWSDCQCVYARPPRHCSLAVRGFVEVYLSAVISQ